MRTAVQLITGFMQGPKLSAGLAELRRKLLPLNLAYLEVCAWGTDPVELARRIESVDAKGVYLVGHSFGGWACTKVADALERLDVLVDGMFLADGVSRDRPRVLTIPDNVIFVSSWRQNINKIIKGSPLAMQPPTVHVIDAWCDCRHNHVDGLPEFHAAVLNACQP